MKQRKNKNAGISPPGPRKDPVHAAADYGIDIPMLIDNIARTPAERIRRHQIALETFKALRKAKHVKSIGEIRNIEGGRRIRVLTVDSLIKARKAMNRPRDREAILQLEAIKKLQKKS
ncbi:MAG: hypothetical protein ACYTDW_15645 [Planctomycetota bacterium]|jgi:hypothetical protein